ncbi:MAG: c-type cytochrome [Verrucomicrobiales bacterium]
MTVRIWAALMMFHAAAAAEPPQWIWRSQTQRPSPAGERGYLVRAFSVTDKVERATIEAACAGYMEVFLNGQFVGTVPEVRHPLKKQLPSGLIRGGQNTIAVFGRTTAYGIGVVLQLDLELQDGRRELIRSDGGWHFSLDNPKGWNQPGFNTAGWEAVRVFGQLGDPPFGHVFQAKKAEATPAGDITVPPGFKVELLRSAQPGEGSWICLAIDARGRLYISPQEDNCPILRITLDDGGQVAKVDPLPLPVFSAMGMVWAFNSLYVSGVGPEGQGIYRLFDDNGDGDLDRLTLFKKVPGGGGEHGAHGIVLGRDNHLYIAMGNATPPVEGIATESPCQHFAEDDLLPRIKDPVATFFDQLKSPYGHILRTDENGTRWELWCVGLRNAYDIDFNAEGELFTYDSDAEWDVGLPWYRPSRILHLVPGGEYGFREGSAKMPDYYPDTLPAVCNIGLGSPTGVKFGTNSNWPGKWHRAFYAMDWTYGRILAVHLQPQGSSHHGKPEEFVKGKGMPVTDLEFAPDGPMYFTVGGRGTQGGLYRVSWQGPAEIADDPPPIVCFTPADFRRAAFKKRSFKAEDLPLRFIPALDGFHTSDSFLPFTVRTNLERFSSQWKLSDMVALLHGELNGVFAELSPLVLLTAARIGERIPNLLAESLRQTNPGRVTRQSHYSHPEELTALRLRMYRALEVSLARQGKPMDAQDLAKHLTPVYPARDFRLNRELSQLLVFLQWPGVVEPTLKLMEQAHRRWAAEGKKLPDPLKLGPQEESIWFARVLCEVPGTHFAPGQRDRYFAWFVQAREFKGANNFLKFLEAIRDRALAKLDAVERAKVEQSFPVGSGRSQSGTPAAPARTLVKNWTLAELEPHFGAAKADRNFDRGREIYSSMLCAKCHQCGTDGAGSVGPDLTGLGGRFSARDIIEAILDPSKAVPDQYASFVFTMNDGSSLRGQIAEETADAFLIYADPFGTTKATVKKSNLAQREVSKLSLMPAGLLNNLKLEEILDLLAFVAAGGDQGAPAFKAPQ